MALHNPRGPVLNELREQEAIGFSIGVCATGEPSTLLELIDAIEEERYPPRFRLERIIVVASACGPRSLDRLRLMQGRDPRIVLVEEDERRGKANAINRIIAEAIGDFLAFVNADALPSRGSLSRLLRAIDRDESVGMVSASPVISTGKGMESRVLQLMWGTHNTCTSELNGTTLSNHGTDELMVVRLHALADLPPQVVNDGAFIGGRMHANGFRVETLESAMVRVDVPSEPAEIIRQRRRILYGHIQVWSMIGRVPLTAESLMVIAPGLGFGTVVKTVARRPKLILALPFAAVLEFISFVAALQDSSSKAKKHTVWDRYAD
jgi:biofilm PGA synthesis N-glycosyltransferase PgaC